MEGELSYGVTHSHRCSLRLQRGLSVETLTLAHIGYFAVAELKKTFINQI